MSDEELRHLARAAQAAPADLETGWRHASALERVGDRRGHRAALCRLARVGDERARSALEDLVALPATGSERGRGRRRARLRAPWRVRTATLALRGQAWLLAATDDVLLLLDREALVAVDTRSLVERWRRPCAPTPEVAAPGARSLPFALLAEDLVLGEGHDLLLLEGATGRELARGPQQGRLVELVAADDRAVAIVRANEGRLPLLVGLDLGEPFGRRLWKRLLRRPLPEAGGAPGPPLLHGIQGGVVLLRAPAEGLRVEDGAPEGTDLARRLESHGELGEWSAPSRSTSTLDGRTLQVARRPASQTVLDPSALELVTADGVAARLPLSPLRAADARTFDRAACRVALVDGLGYVVSTPYVPGLGPRPDLVNVLGVELDPPGVGLEVNLPVALGGEFGEVEGIALDGALLVVVTTYEACTLLRLEPEGS